MTPTEAGKLADHAIIVIKKLDKLSFPDADEEEGVTDHSSLKVPIMAAVLDAYRRGVKNTKQLSCANCGVSLEDIEIVKKAITE